MSEWDKVFEEMKTELLEQKTPFHIIPKMVLKETENQLGYGSVTINGIVTVKGIRVMKSKKAPGEYYLSLPTIPGKDSYLEACRMEPDLYHAVFKTVVKDLLIQQMNQQTAEKEISVEVKLVEKGNLVAVASVSCDPLTIRQIRVLQVKGKRFISFPQCSSADGYQDLLYFNTGTLRETVTRKVLKRCEELQLKQKRL